MYYAYVKVSPHVGNLSILICGFCLGHNFLSLKILQGLMLVFLFYNKTKVKNMKEAQQNVFGTQNGQKKLHYVHCISPFLAFGLELSPSLDQKSLENCVRALS